VALFAPPLGTLAASLGRRPLAELWADPGELVRLTLEAAARSRASALLFPFDELVLAEAAGAKLAWTPLGPVLDGSDGIDVAELEAGDVLAAGRVPVALAAARPLAASAPAVLVAQLPAPATLVAQLGGDPADDDQLAAAEDVCAAFARGLLEAGATWLVVQGHSAGADDLGPLWRLAGHFRARVAVAGDPDVAVVPVAALTDPARPAPVAGGAGLVLTDAPVPAGTDLAVWSRQAAGLLGEAR
jgi:uroporphyrinogen-III decarboxylase